MYLNLNINNSRKEYKLSYLFTLKRWHTLSVEDKENFPWDIPCINWTITNNWVLCYLSKEVEELWFEKIKSPALSVVRVGNWWKTFVQNEDFYIADNAFALIPKQNISVYNLFFISVLLDLEQIKYCYGRTVTNDYLETIIKLPSDRNWEPDRNFMESYIKNLHHKPITTKNKPWGHGLDLHTRKEFKFKDLFVVTRWLRHIAENREPWNIRYFSASQENNWLTDMISNPLFIDKDALIYSTFWNCYYIWWEFTASDEISILKNDNLTKYSWLFISTIITANKYKYAYWRKAFQNKFIDETIKLPVDKNWEPDREFMENYIKNLPYWDRI